MRSAAKPGLPRKAGKGKKKTNKHQICYNGSQTHPPTKRPLVIKSIKLISTGLLLTALMGCSAMSLQCGVDGDSSFVNINSAPQVLSQNSRNLAELCGFAYTLNEE